MDPSGFDPDALDGSTLTDLPGGWGLSFTGPIKAGPPLPPSLPVTSPPPRTPQQGDGPSEGAQVGAASPPVDVGTTGSASGYEPQPVTTAPTDWIQHRVVQAEGGFVAGLALGMVPFAGVGQQFLDAAKVLPHGTPEARRGLAVGQIFGGIVTMVGGLTGEVLGGVASATGIGAAVGVPAIVVSTGVVLGGAGNIAAGIRGLMTTGSGSRSGAAKGGGGGSSRSSSYPSAGEMGKRLGVNQNDFHRNIKPQIVKDFAQELKGIGAKNPDIGVDGTGKIVLKNPQTGAEVFTDVPLGAYAE